ncbi:hypothetical protein EYC80_006654 [Monilinia laxa]|uniref:Uncharacterized protein n=2 Tax=Monilinia laxa TaxID=61186 RepID=A0A5N6JU11_MONLA|nr:hypothetical protein EYC80_006654 [Monilinia laxa]
MPALDVEDVATTEAHPLTRLPFGPITKRHILNCSYDNWHAKYRSSTLKSRIIPLTPEFLSYLREDGIVLPSEIATFPPPENYNNNSTSDGWNEDEVAESDPSDKFAEIHKQIREIISELGGSVVPKLNWSAPKDATWISLKQNSMECNTPNDIYLLLKSSDFITHDLEHAFDGCDEDPTLTKENTKFVLVLRKWFKVNPSCEFRCFVRDRRLIGICQRDLNYFDFLFPLIPTLREAIQLYFDKILKDTFPDRNFSFDVYIPEPFDKVRLVDINPWAPRTDPLLFSWLELLTLSVPPPLLGTADSPSVPPLPTHSSDEDDGPDAIEEIEWMPDFRLVKKDDPEAYSFASPQYSAHKMPQEVVEAGASGEGGMREFADNWQRMLNGELEMMRAGEDSDDDDDDNDPGGRVDT